MRERPILFSAPMVRAILDGRKTQTRRVIKNQDCVEHLNGEFVWVHDPKHGHPCDYSCTSDPFQLCPYGQPGDRLWVRETHFIESDGESVAYRANGEFLPGWAERGLRWRPSIHMPRWASRITLEIIGIRVERLQDISRGDAMSEGCPFPNMADGESPVSWFSDLWQSINGPDSWDKNPWVWLVEFTRIRNSD